MLPESAERMIKLDNYDVKQFKTWFSDPNDYYQKTVLIRGHFEKIKNSDAILVLNYEKHNADNYIGGNVLMEMALAFHLGKPIYLVNSIPNDSSFEEEIIALEPVVLNGTLEDITKTLEP